MKVTVSEYVAQRAVEYGLGETLIEAESQVQVMVENSAPITHHLGNRRYDDWLIRMDGLIVVGIHSIKCMSCDDRKRVPVFEQCEDCTGSKCKGCRFRGEVRRLIPCPSCAK